MQQQSGGGGGVWEPWLPIEGGEGGGTMNSPISHRRNLRILGMGIVG